MDNTIFDQGARYVGYTFRDLCTWQTNPLCHDADPAKVSAEIERRERVMCGDRRAMTAGERLRFAKSGAICGGEI